MESAPPNLRAATIYRQGIVEEDARLRRVDTAVRIRKQKRSSILCTLRARMSAVAAANPRAAVLGLGGAAAASSNSSSSSSSSSSTAMPPGSAPRAATSPPPPSSSSALAPSQPHPSLEQLQQAQPSLLKDLLSASDPRALCRSAQGLSVLARDPTNAEVLTATPGFPQRVMFLLHSMEAMVPLPPLLIDTLKLINELLQHDHGPGMRVYRCMEVQQTHNFLIALLRPGHADLAVAQQAVLCLTHMALSVHNDGFHGRSAGVGGGPVFTLDLAAVVAQSPGAVEALGVHLDSNPVMAAEVCHLLTSMLEEGARGAGSNPSRVSARVAYCALLPRLMSLAAVGGDAPLGSLVRMHAVGVVERLCRHGGSPLAALVRECPGSMAHLVRILSAPMPAHVQMPDACSIPLEVLKIVGHVMRGLFGVTELIAAGVLPVVCQLAQAHHNSEVRQSACGTLREFMACPVDLVAPCVSGEAGQPLLSVLVAKARSDGDISMQVRTEAAYAIVQCVRVHCPTLSPAIRQRVVVLCADVLSSHTSDPAVLEGVLESLGAVLGFRGGGAATAVLCTVFEAEGGVDALEGVLDKASPVVVERLAEEILSKHFPHAAFSGMDLDEEEENRSSNQTLTLAQEFACIDANGRLW